MGKTYGYLFNHVRCTHESCLSVALSSNEAILYLPHGFATTGYLLAIPIMFGATVLYLYSSSCLLDSWKLESAEKPDSEQTSLVQTTKHRTILSYPELAYRALGTTGESMVKTGIALMQSGVCLTYRTYGYIVSACQRLFLFSRLSLCTVIFVPQNLHTSALQLFGWNVRPNIWLIVMVMIQIPLSWIRDIRKFTITNLLANALILYGLITCLSFAFANMAGNFLERLASLSPYQSTWFMFIGTAVSIQCDLTCFMYSQHGLIMYLRLVITLGTIV